MGPVRNKGRGREYWLILGEFDELQFAGFFKQVEVLFGLLLGLPGVCDGGTHAAGVLAVEGGFHSLDNRGVERAADKHSGPGRGLQNNPVGTAEIQRATEEEKFLQGGFQGDMRLCVELGGLGVKRKGADRN
jgi:hypothetical protein